MKSIPSACATAAFEWIVVEFEDRQSEIVVGQGQADFRAAENDAIGAGILAALNDLFQRMAGILP